MHIFYLFKDFFKPSFCLANELNFNYIEVALYLDPQMCNCEYKIFFYFFFFT